VIWLKQGDPLTYFLFFIVVKGLSGAITRAEERLFIGFKGGVDSLSVSYLQYVDGALFLLEATVENLW
jgi:hypothetical protein